MPAFMDPVGVARAFRNNGPTVLAAIEANCTQAQLDAIQALAVPPVTDQEKVELLARAEHDLARVGATDIVAVVATERERIEATIPKEVEPIKEEPIVGEAK